MSNKIYHLNSWLFVPSNVQKFIDKALNSSANVIILDLEDGIDQNKRTEALENIVNYCKPFQDSKKKVAVRINQEFAKHDLSLLAKHNTLIDYVVIPKFENIDSIKIVLEQLTKAQLEHVKLVLMIESKEVFTDFPKLIADIEQYRSYLFGFMIGAADLAASYDVENDSELIKKLTLDVINYSLLHDYNYLDSPCFDLNNLDVLKEELLFLKRNGCFSKSLITPKHIELTNELLNFTDQEYEDAKQIIELSKTGAARFKGKMIDEAMAKKARNIIICKEGDYNGN